MSILNWKLLTKKRSSSTQGVGGELQIGTEFRRFLRF
jgi:hypothetical protein